MDLHFYDEAYHIQDANIVLCNLRIVKSNLTTQLVIQRGGVQRLSPQVLNFSHVHDGQALTLCSDSQSSCGVSDHDSINIVEYLKMLNPSSCNFAVAAAFRLIRETRNATVPPSTDE